MKLKVVKDIDLNGIDWLIVGGESGYNNRELREQWVVELRDKAQETRTAFFFKQWGGFNKKKNGRLLQGKEYSEYPVIK